MTTRDNRYEGSTSMSGITADKLVDFLDRLFLKPQERNTVIVLDNDSIRQSKSMKEMRAVWESEGFSSSTSRLIRRTSTSPRHCGVYSRESGYDRKTMCPTILSSTPPTGPWPPSKQYFSLTTLTIQLNYDYLFI